MQTPLHSPVTVAAARAGHRAGTSWNFPQPPWSLLLRCRWPKETFPNPSEISQPLYTDGRRRCRTYVQVYLKELAGYQGKAGHSVLDTAQQTQGHQCWGERKGVSDSLLGSRANTPSPARQLFFFQKSPGLQVDSGQPLGPISECSVLSGNAAGDEQRVPLLQMGGTAHSPHQCHLYAPRGLLSIIRDRER